MTVTGGQSGVPEVHPIDCLAGFRLPSSRQLRSVSQNTSSRTSRPNSASISGKVTPRVLNRVVEPRRSRDFRERQGFDDRRRRACSVEAPRCTFAAGRYMASTTIANADGLARSLIGVLSYGNPRSN